MLAEVLVERGFEARPRNLFLRRTSDGISALSFMADKWGDPSTEVRFTAHLGFLSNRLAEVFGPKTVRGVGPDAVHWYRWIGYLDGLEEAHDQTDEATDELEGPKDLMWHVPATREAVLAEVLPDIDNRALPALEAHSSDAGLRDDWSRSVDPWLHRAVQAAYLAVLIDALGPESAHQNAIERVRQLAGGGSSDAAKALEAIEQRSARQ